MTTQRLPALPGGFSHTRDGLHQIAFFVLSPARYQAVGRMGLSASPGGFGTPEFEGRVIRVEEDRIVDQHGDASASRPISTIADAAAFVGIEYEVDWFADFHDPPAPIDPGEHLGVDPEATAALGDWFAFAWEILEATRAQAGQGDEPSQTQLWPEHFDAAIEMGNADDGRRASFGASPGDGAHPEPYVYVAPWSRHHLTSTYWNDTAFAGASLGYQRLGEAADPVDLAVEFMLKGRRLLAGNGE